MIRGNCRGCNAPVVWIKSSFGKPMICNAEPVTSTGVMGLLMVLENGVVVKNPRAGLVGHESHFASCPDAKKFRRQK